MSDRVGKILTGDDVTADLTVDCDVCIVGSGPGGSWLAHELAAQGKSVVMLEEGGYHTRAEFDLTEGKAFGNLYQDLGNRTTDDQSISLLQGRSVGGGTTVNWCSSFRTPDRILKNWAEVHGVEGVTSQALTPHWEHIEKRLHIAEWPAELMNKNNQALWNGLGKLNYERGLIRRNVNGCANLGYCGMGCPIDAKQSMLVTVIPDAVEKGLTLYANASVRRLEVIGRKVTAVHAEILDPKTQAPKGPKLKVNAKVVSVSGGALNSPAVLLRSGLDGGGNVGKRTWLHPVVLMMAMFEDQVNAFAGAPQSVYSHHFIERGPGKLGYFLEVPPVHPMLGATVGTNIGQPLMDLMKHLPHLQVCLAISVDGLMPEEQGGTVKLKSGAYSRLSFDYALGPANWEAFLHASKEMAKIQFAAGAQKVMSLHNEPVVMNSVAEIDKLDAAPWERAKVRVVTAHQMGGCRMGKDPNSSVVDSTLKYHGLDNLFVVDGSVFPSSLGVNPQESIMGISRWASQFVAAAV